MESTSSNPILLLFLPWQWGSEHRNKKKTCANGAQFLPGLQFKYAHKSILIYLCFLLRPAGWPAVSGPERGGQTTSKNCYRKAAQMSEFWSRVNCKYGSSSLQIFWDFQWFHVVHPRLQQPDISTAVFLKFWDYFCLFLGLSFSLLRVFLTATSKYIY